jgi:drug/metabolite transporter (DMT)-like permease
MYLLLAFAVVVLGVNWPIMAISLESFTPLWMAAFRVGLAAIVVGGLGALTGNVMVPARRDLPIVLSVAIFRLATVMVLVFSGLELIAAGRASVLVWTSALWTVPIAATFLGECMSARTWTGLAIGIAGVLLLSELWGNNWREPDVIVGTLLLLLAAIVNAATAVHIRGHRWTIGPLQALPWQLMIATLPLIVGGFIVDGPPDVDWTPELAWLLGYQAILASGGALWAQVVVLQRLPAISTNVMMMGVPVVGVVSSSLVLHEPVTATLALGIGLVLAGVAVNLPHDHGRSDQ